MSFGRRAGVWIAWALLAGCSATRPPAAPDFALPASYPQAEPGATAAIDARWWTLFGDQTLDALVDQALSRNVDLRLAAARVDETAVAVGLARSAQWPSVDLGASSVRSRVSVLTGQPVSPNGPESTSNRLVLSSSFEVDLWGRLRHATRAAEGQLLAASYARDAVRAALVSGVAQAYFGLRALDLQLAALDRQLDQRGESLRLLERRAAGGVASSLELAQARAGLAAARAQRPELERQRAALQSQLGVLTGVQDRNLAAAGVALPAPLSPPPGLPSQLLERRPDVQQAEASMRASFEQFDQTRKSAWPTLRLTGTYGAQSNELADLLRSGARLWSIGPSLLVSLFDAGLSTARTDEARARAEQAALAYQKAAQAAFREVADALAASRSSALQEGEYEAQRTAAAEALRIAERRYAAGYAGYLDVIDAQRSQLDAELALLRARQARLDASITLVKALGGGWQPADPAATAAWRSPSGSAASPRP